MRVHNIEEYARLYHSLVALHKMESSEALQLLYTLNTANLDTARERYNLAVYECSPRRFMELIQETGEPYSTLQALYNHLERLEADIHWDCITDEQKDACKHLNAVLQNLRSQYFRLHKADIEDARNAVHQALFGLALVT